MAIITNRDDRRIRSFSGKVSKLFFLIGFSLFIAVSASAQGDEDPPPNELGEVDTPFDGGVSLLVAAGVAYGIGVARKKQSRADDKEPDVTEK